MHRTSFSSPTPYAAARLETDSCNGALKKCGKSGKRDRTGLSRSSVFVILQPLEPDAGADLMNAFADLQVVLISK